jgi:excisionase family DNA binding protein
VAVHQSNTLPSLAEYLTVGEAAKFLGVSPWTLRNWDRDGRLKSRRHPKNGYRIYRQLDLEAILQDRRITGADGDTLAAPRCEWSRGIEHEHLVQFYETEEYLVRSVSTFFAAALRSGEACVLIATASHRAAIDEALASGGSCDLLAARARGQYVALDAAETLATFMVNGQPDPQRFNASVGDVIRRAGQSRPGVRAFGEMVALLWAAGNRAGAMCLEELWNDLQKNVRFTLFCAYPMSGFGNDDGQPVGLASVCAQHSRVIPAESYSALETQDHRLRAIATLQQKAAALEAEIERHKATERALREAKAAAEDASRAKDQFLAVLSHELRTPLTPVLMTIAAMEAEPVLVPRVREDLAMIRRNIALETQLIDDLLDLSRVINGKMVLHLQDVDLHLVIASAVEMIAPEAHDRQLDVCLDLRATAARVAGDSARLHQALWNLLKNAMKFTPPQGTLTVRTRDGSARRRLVIEVQDTGIGIEPAALTTIFCAFYQGAQGTSRAFGGLGLGLAISKAVVEMHGGTIAARSDGAGRGACFTIELPANQPTPIDAPRGAAPGQATARPREARDGLHVLLVEDHADTLRMLRRLLESTGHRVTPAASVAAAVRAASELCDFDVLISDIGLPDGTGIDVIAAVRARHPGVPAIALTGYGMEQDVRNSADAGFTAHLTKPIDFASLRGTIVRLAAAKAARL